MGNCCGGEDKDRPTGYNVPNEQLSNYVIELIRAIDVPKKDIISNSDPYIVLKIRNKNGEVRSKIQTLTRENTQKPVWNCRRLFKCDALFDTLEFKCYDKDTISEDDCLGSFSSKVSLITPKSIPPSVVSLELKSKQENINIKLYYKLYKFNKDTLKKLTVFFIRHGESIWNKDQSNHDYLSMLEQCDSPLAKNGMKEALELNKIWNECKLDNNILQKYHMNENDLNQFLNTELILSSPLTRAVQTCLLTMIGHNSMKEFNENKNNDNDEKSALGFESKREYNVTFERNLREIKHLGGIDTLSKYKSDEIRERVINDINKNGELFEDFDIELNECNFDALSYGFNDTYSKWWTSLLDTKSEFDERLNDFMNYIAFENKNTMICFGHSLWIKRFFQIYLNEKINDNSNEESAKNMKEYFDECKNGNVFDNKNKKEIEKQMKDENEAQKILYENLKDKKVQNCGCVRVNITMDLTTIRQNNGVVIDDVKLLFGSKFV